mmetsp:Transcript_21828/g.30590  ORF Transcript_21828/g.30590 Transcript_21828/m.30590 type:complete len:293 (-) Transcript_21828:393-1271(-)
MAPAQFCALSLLLIIVRTPVVANIKTMCSLPLRKSIFYNRAMIRYYPRYDFFPDLCGSRIPFRAKTTNYYLSTSCQRKTDKEDGNKDSNFSSNSVEEKLTRFAGIVWAANDRVNLVSRKSNNIPEDIRKQHIQDCLPLVSTMKDSFRSLAQHDTGMELNPLKVLDVGSGGGFPAMILAISKPDWKVTMLEATGKKCDFLRSTSLSLELDTRVECARAEDMARKVGWRESFPAVTARAVADLRILVELCLPFVSVGGYMFAMKGPPSAAQVEIDSAEKALRLLGGEVGNYFIS